MMSRQPRRTPPAYPRFRSTSAMPLIPMPPIPTNGSSGSCGACRRRAWCIHSFLPSDRPSGGRPLRCRRSRFRQGKAGHPRYPPPLGIPQGAGPLLQLPEPSGSSMNRRILSARRDPVSSFSATMSAAPPPPAPGVQVCGPPREWKGIRSDPSRSPYLREGRSAGAAHQEVRLVIGPGLSMMNGVTSHRTPAPVGRRHPLRVSPACLMNDPHRPSGPRAGAGPLQRPG